MSFTQVIVKKRKLTDDDDRVIPLYDWKKNCSSIKIPNQPIVYRNWNYTVFGKRGCFQCW